MKDKILTLIIGILIGAIITSICFLVYEKINISKTKDNENTSDFAPRVFQEGGFDNGNPPELPDGEMPEAPDGEMPEISDGERPEMPNSEMNNSKNNGRQKGKDNSDIDLQNQLNEQDSSNI